MFGVCDPIGLLFANILIKFEGVNSFVVDVLSIISWSIAITSPEILKTVILLKSAIIIFIK